MKLMIIGANGKVGQLLVEEGIKRGHDMTAVVRHENQSLADSVLMKDLFDLTKDDIASSDIIISAIGAWSDESYKNHIKSVDYLANLIKGSSKQLVIVGGAGSLYLDESKTLQLYETQDFPREYKGLAKAMSDGLQQLRTYSEIDWLYVSPAAIFDADGVFTKSYQIGGEQLLLDEKGESYISYRDYAFALLDILESDDFHKQRISLLRK